MADEAKQDRPSIFVKVARHMRSRLFAGMIVVTPLWLTYFALKFFFEKLDSIFAPHVDKWIGISIPGLGFVFLILFLYVIGIITTNIVGRSLVNFGESILDKIPFVKNIYQATKQILSTISASRSMVFQKVVYVEYPRVGLRAIAFVTNAVYDPKDNKKYMTVFIPTTPNPTSGVFELVPAEDVMETNMSVEEGIKMVISGGLVVPAKLSPETTPEITEK
jgi:uncharacterized membrane protein